MAQDVLYTLTCPLSTVRANGSIAIQVVQGVSSGVTVYGVVAFERRMHQHLTNHGHRPMLKLISFKAIVGLEGLQDILFASLGNSGAYFPKPPYHVSWADFSRGIPQFLLSLEMVIVSVAFLWSFTFQDYKKLMLQGQHPYGAWHCFADTFDVSDIWQGVKYMFTCLTSSTYLEGYADGRVVDGLSEEKKEHKKQSEQIVQHPLEFKNSIDPIIEHHVQATV